LALQGDCIEHFLAQSIRIKNHILIMIAFKIFKIKIRQKTSSNGKHQSSIDPDRLLKARSGSGFSKTTRAWPAIPDQEPEKREPGIPARSPDATG